MTSPEANRSRRITPFIRARVSRSAPRVVAGDRVGGFWRGGVRFSSKQYQLLRRKETIMENLAIFDSSSLSLKCMPRCSSPFAIGQPNSGRSPNDSRTFYCPPCPNLDSLPSPFGQCTGVP
jgi:hypothetical protein